MLFGSINPNEYLLEDMPETGEEDKELPIDKKQAIIVSTVTRERTYLLSCSFHVLLASLNLHPCAALFRVRSNISWNTNFEFTSWSLSWYIKYNI